MHPELVPFAPKAAYSRRDFVTSTFAGGLPPPVFP